MAQIIIYGLAQKPLRSRNGLVSEIEAALARTEHEKTCDVTVSLSENVLGPSKGGPLIVISGGSRGERLSIKNRLHRITSEVHIRLA